jgi:hypothetical protein
MKTKHATAAQGFRLENQASTKMTASGNLSSALKKTMEAGRKKWLLSAFIAACFAGNGAENVWSQGRTDTIAQTGQTVPGGNGTLSTLDNTFFPSVGMNDAGQVVFQANLAGTSGGTADDLGLYRGSGGALTQMAREGQSAPGGSTFGAGFGGDPKINSLGEVAFTSALSNNLIGLFRSRGGSNITQIAREGQTVPDGNGRYSGFEDLAFNDLGQVAWRGFLTNTSGGSTDNQGVFRGDGTAGSATEIVRKGEAAPDGNGTFVAFDSVGLSSGGQVAFGAFLSPNSNSHRGIFRGVGGSVTQIARTGYAAPGGGTFDFLQHPTINDAGQVAFQASMTGTSDSSGIFRGNGETLTNSPLVQIVRRNQAAPDGNGSFSIMNIIGMNSSGQVGFTGQFSGTSGGENDNFGLYRGSGGAITQIAREGQSVPDGNGVISGFGSYELNNAGAMAFQGFLIGTSGGTTDDRGLYVSDGTDLLEAIREGDSVLGSTVTDIRLADGGFNSHGQVAYSATLANGSQVVQRWTPEIRYRSTTSGSWDTASRWTLGLTATEIHDVFIDTPGSLTVTGPTTDRTVRSLRVGGNTGQATLDLRNGAVLTALNGTTIANKGTLTGDGVIGGNVTNLAGGTVRANNVTITGTLTNQGVIRGSGYLDANIANQSGGSIRASNGDVMILGGSGLSNLGLIEIHAGELAVAATVINAPSSGLISVRNGGTLRADGGLSNRGSLVMSSGMATIHGDIENVGIIQVSGGAQATFFDDIVQANAMQVSSVGSTNSTAVILGSFSGSGGFTGGGDVFALGDLRPGNSPASVLYDGNLFLGGQTNTEIELGGLGLGQFDQLVVSGDLNLAGDLLVSLIDGHSLGFNQQYLIAEISGVVTGQFSGLGEGALVGNFGGIDMFISYSAGSGNDIGLFTAIPEPGCGLALIMVGLGCVMSRRRS